MKASDMHTLFVMASATTNSSLGITLIEALVVISILSILTALATPQFQTLHERRQTQQAVNDFKSTLLFARSEAIRRGGQVAIQKQNNGTGICKNATTNQDWSCGWFVFIDHNSNGTWNASEPKLHEVQLNGQVNVMHTSGGRSFRVDRYGMASGLNAKGLTFSPERSGISSAATQTLCMSSGGRIRTVHDASC